MKSATQLLFKEQAERNGVEGLYKTGDTNSVYAINSLTNDKDTLLVTNLSREYYTYWNRKNFEKTEVYKPVTDTMEYQITIDSMPVAMAFDFDTANTIFENFADRLRETVITDLPNGQAIFIEMNTPSFKMPVKHRRFKMGKNRTLEEDVILLVDKQLKNESNRK